MENSKFFTRVLALVLVFIMVAMLLPWSVMATTVKGNIVTNRKYIGTGIDNDTLNDDGTINWPIKVYDYLADGMLFEFAQNQSGQLYSRSSADDEMSGGQYVLGKSMPVSGAYSTDYTTDAAYSANSYKQYNSTRGDCYLRTNVSAVNYSSPRYLRLKVNTSPTEYNRNYYVSDFYNDNGTNARYSDIRYMVMVYKSSGMPTGTATNYFGSSAVPMSFLINKVSYASTQAESSSWIRYDITSWTNSSTWTYRIFDLYSLGFTSGYTKNLSITPNFNDTTDTLDISHVAYFSTNAAADAFGKQALEFNKEPGEYISGSYWNGANNTAFGMLYASNGKSWNSGGGNPITTNTDGTTNLGGTYAAYYTHQIGYNIPEYRSAADTYNNNRKTGKDANGRFDGSGIELQGENGIYYITDAYITSTQYQAENPGATTFDMSDLDFGGYSLLTKASKGGWTAGLLEGTLGADGTPVYKEETVEYIADLLSKTLTIPQKASNGYNNYSYVAGVKNRAQYGYTEDAKGNKTDNDLAQGLRNALGIYFSGNTRATAPKMGTYAETLAKADKLKGAFLTVYPNIKTCMDAAYYLLNNLFVANSYNQEQDDFRYLTLSSAKLDNGQDAFVFDGGFSYGANVEDIYDSDDNPNGTITQDQYKAATKNAVEYNGFNLEGGDGTISINNVDGKDLYYFANASYARTTRFPFLPVVEAEGVYAGQTDSYYFAEDGKRSYSTEWGTYYNRNYNYVLASNGEFVYHEEDNLFFEFEGDDDVYLFINGQLVLDLGGGHSISNCYFNVNDYVVWARDVLKNPSNYSEAEVARAKALDLENGDIVSFDFYYMERHGYGANMRIVTNMHITDPALRVDKSAYQGGKQIEYGGIVDSDDPIEYNFKLSNIGNTKLYNLTFEDSNIGVTLSPERGLFVAGDDTSTELDDINGYHVTDARGGRLDAEDITAVVTGYQNVGTGGNYIQSGHTYTKVTDGAGTHIYYDEIIVTFADNNALKYFLKTLQSEYTDGTLVDEEQTQRGAGLWVDSSVTFKGIYYTMTNEQEEEGVFDNTVYVSATTRANSLDAASETLRSKARHRVYVTAIPAYYQWAGHELFISKERVARDAAAEAGNESSMLHDYWEFFENYGTDINEFGTKFCDRLGNVVPDDYYDHVRFSSVISNDGKWGYIANYPESGIYEFFLLMYKYGASGVPSDLSTLKASDLNLGEYAIVRVLVLVADVEDSEYVLDYGLSTENLDTSGELFKNDELFGSLSGTQAYLMGFTNQEPSYIKSNITTQGVNSGDYNRINFNALNLSENHRIQTEDGYYNVNMVIPETGKKINYDDFSDMYTLTESGTIKVHVDCPSAWENLYLYYWYDDGRNNVWPGQLMTERSHGNFELAIPGNVPHIIISNGTNQTVDMHINTGQDIWVDIPGTTNASGKLYAMAEYKTTDGIIHATVPEGWGDVYYYCWDAFDHGLNQWPGTKVDTVDENGYYTFNIPGDITNIVINNGANGKQTKDLVIYAGSETWIAVTDKVLGTNEDMGVDYYGATASRSTETVKMHASVPDNWQGASLYYWNSNGSDTDVDWPGLPMTKGTDGLYHIDNIPADVTNVIVNDGKATNAEQTHNLTISAGVETWFDVQVKEYAGKTTVKANVPATWSSAYVYFFNDSGDVESAWPGKAATKVSNGVFTIDAPAGATKYIVHNNAGIQTQDLKLLNNTVNSIEVVGAGDGRPVTDTELHIEPQAGWSKAYVHFWCEDENGNATVSTTWPGLEAKSNEDGTFSVVVPETYAKYNGWFKVNNGSGIEMANVSVKDLYLGAENHYAINERNNGYRLGAPYETGIVYGENAEKEGISFTPTDFMDSYYSLWMAVTVFESKVEADDDPNNVQKAATALGNPINIGKEVQMYKKITILPASVVYYEDDFVGIKYTTEGTNNVLNHYGQGSGSLTQSVDQNQEYGQDSSYQGSANDEITGGSLTNVLVQENAQIATFEFTGTGFEIIGHTHAVKSGTVRVEVYDENGTRVAVKSVITEFDNGDDGGTESIVAVPIIRVSGLEYGKYTVSIKGVPVYDFDNWDKNTSSRPPAKESYIYIDGVRIYQPIDNTDSNIKNLALGKDVDVKGYASSPFVADLTDGAYEKNYQSGVNDAAWFAFKNTGNETTGNVNASGRGVLTIDLGCEAEVSSLRVFNYKGSGVGAFKYINIYYSTDGINFPAATDGTINPDSTKTSGNWATFDFSTPITARYIKLAVGVDSNATVLINEVEVYGTEAVEAGKNDAYLETESGAKFTEIRNLIAERKAFAIRYDDAAGLTVSGGTSTWIENRNDVLPGNRDVKWTNNIVNSVNDYLLAGPNNEVYMMESTAQDKTALVFYVTETSSKVHNMQIAVRAMDYGAYTGAQETGHLNAEIQYGAMVNDSLVWKTLATTTSSAEQYFTIPYNECPYDAENDRYQVVLRVADTQITGMVSYTTIKLNGLTLNTLNEDEVPDVIYSSDEINNTIVDSNGNELDTSKFVNFAGLVNQMNSNVVLTDNTNGEPAPEGVNTSALGTLYDSFTPDTTKNFVLTENSKFYIVSENETKPNNNIIETVQLAQSQFAVEDLPTSKALEVVWGKEQYAESGDILIYLSSSYAAEEFKIVVSDKARVYAKDDRGVLYGLNTLQKHFRLAKGNAIKGFTLQDKPDTAERTVHLDVARKYLTKNWIVNYIKEMSWMGYNALELHFSEDGGLRADLWGDPSLYTSSNNNNFSWTVGSRLQYWVSDCADPDPAVYGQGGYLTTAEMVEICQVALQYNIEIIPSFDTPAHVDWLTWNYYNNYSSKGIYKSFNYNGQTYTLPQYINYRSNTTADKRWSCLDLGNATVQKFALAMYADVAEFFKIHAGSTKFNIGGDEVELTGDSYDTWNYADFYNYVNSVSALLKSKGYKVRMYNDYLGRQKYINLIPAGTTLPALDKDIELVIWTVDDPWNDKTYGLKDVKSWYDEGRTVYNGMNYWTYYVLRYANTLASTNANYKKDARDPSNTNWSFYCNDESITYQGVENKYSHWNPTLFDKATTLSNKFTIWDSQLAGGYFMVWNDYAGLNTEVEMWNGVWDRSGSVNNGKYYYSLIERMWSNAIKQWDWVAHDTPFNTFEDLRDAMGFFPGYVATTSGSHAVASKSTRTPLTTVSNDAYRTPYTVTFINYDGSVLDTQIVKEGFSATAPETNPTRPSDVWYDYTFTGWDKEFTNITADTVVKAQYSQQATTAGRIGYLGVSVSGGTNFTMSIDGSAAKPMGTEYVNPSMDFGKEVTLTAQTTNGNKFVAWIDAKTGVVLTTSATYSFYTSGNDIFMAVYSTDIPDGGLVTFRNNKTNQVLDIQYYTSTDTISFPANPTYPGYVFAGWNYTETEIKTMLAQGKDVTVSTEWRHQDVYFNIDVNGGYITESGGVTESGYVGYKGTTVVADKAPAGTMFAHWIDEEGNILSYSEEYKFYPYKDTILTAVFVSDNVIGVDIIGTKPAPEVETPEEKTTFTVYFENNWLWSDVCVYYWGVDGSPSWAGVAMNKIGTVNGHDLYSYEVPLGVTGMIINGIKNDGSDNRDQTPDITEFVDGRQYSMTWNNGNDVAIDDSKVQSGSGTTQTQDNLCYIYVSEEWAADNAWFAAYVWVDGDDTDNMWYKFDRVSGNVYKVEFPATYTKITIVRMKGDSTEFSWDNKLTQTADYTIHPDDEQNMVVINTDGVSKGNMNTIFFVNEYDWSTVDAYYKDQYGTHKVETVFVETDENGKDVYSMLVPESALQIIFTNGNEIYKYVSTEKIADRSIFGFVPVPNQVDKDITVNVGIDTDSLGDSNVVIFDWSVIADTGYTFVNAGVLLVKEEDYIESTFVKGTIDPNVIQFAPAVKYQLATGIHSITIPQVEVSDAWIACAYVQYRDAEGNLRTKYSKQVTGKK